MAEVTEACVGDHWLEVALEDGFPCSDPGLFDPAD
jgi:hypothetical protein